MSRTVLIGLDGATFSILDPLMESGVMPFLRTFVNGGARAVLLSTPHPLTAQAWPAMTTGRSPSHTGITDFIKYHAADGPGHFQLTGSHDLRCETIWSMASRQGRTVTALNFYGLWPPQPVAGYTISGFVPWRHLKDAVYPPGFYTTVSRLPNFRRQELATDPEIERKCIEGLPPEEYDEWIALHIRKERQWLEILRYLMSNDATDLTAIVFEGVDKIQHLCWRFLDPRLFPAQPTAWEARIRSLCLDYFRELDSVISEVVALAGNDSRVFMASDHGFGPSTLIVYINEWLHRKGYLEWADGSTVGQTGKHTSDHLQENATRIDWNRTKAYAISASSNGIWLRLGARSNDGFGREYELMRSELVDALFEFRDPVSGERVITNVRTREEVYPGLGAESAPDLLLTLSDGGFVSVLKADAVVRGRPEPVGTHRPEGVFMARGPGICEGRSHESLSILDVAPTLLYSLHLPVPVDLEGVMPTGVFDQAQLKANPPRLGAPTLPTSAGVRAVPNLGDAERDAEIIERLKALGYV